MGMQKLLKSSIAESSKQAWTNALTGKACQDLKFRLSVDQVLYLRTVDTKKELARKS